jgi:endonuclease YncB( thermonuclease family)
MLLIIAQAEPLCAILRPVPADDTSLRSRDVYNRRLAEMTPGERTKIGAALWQAGHATQLSAWRLRYPLADESEILFQLAITRFGEVLARKAYGRL